MNTSRVKGARTPGISQQDQPPSAVHNKRGASSCLDTANKAGGNILCAISATSKRPELIMHHGPTAHSPV